MIDPKTYGFFPKCFAFLAEHEPLFANSGVEMLSARVGKDGILRHFYTSRAGLDEKRMFAFEFEMDGPRFTVYDLTRGTILLEEDLVE